MTIELKYLFIHVWTRGWVTLHWTTGNILFPTDPIVQRITVEIKQPYLHFKDTGHPLIVHLTSEEEQQSGSMW